LTYEIGLAPVTEKPPGHEGQPRQRVIQSARLGKEQPSGTHGARVSQPAISPHATNRHAGSAAGTGVQQNVHSYTQRDYTAVPSHNTSPAGRGHRVLAAGPAGFAGEVTRYGSGASARRCQAGYRATGRPGYTQVTRKCLRKPAR